MKKTLLTVGALLLAAPAFANFVGPGATDMVTTTSSIKDMKDDQEIILKGHIVRQVDFDRYVFKDSTGEVGVEIEGDAFMGQTVTPADQVRIAGAVEKRKSVTTVDVDSVSIEKY